MNAIERTMKTKVNLAKKYDVPTTAIVWRDGKKFIVVLRKAKKLL